MWSFTDAGTGLTTFMDSTEYTNSDTKQWKKLVAEDFSTVIAEWKTVVLFSRNRCKDCDEYAAMIEAILEMEWISEEVDFHEVNIADPLNLWTRKSSRMKIKAWLSRGVVPYVAVFDDWIRIGQSPSKSVKETREELLKLLLS